MLKKLLNLSLVLALSLSLCSCTPSTPTQVDTTTKFISEGFTLSIPNEYVDLLIVDTTGAKGKDGTFFSVHEKASVEAAKVLFPEDEAVGGGFLFGIGRVNEDEFHEMMMYGMNGADVFAKDSKGNYYIYYHPTDVQLLRVEYTDADWEQWTHLCEWAFQIKQTFIDDNPGLTGYTRTYTDIDCALHYIAYGEGSAQLTNYGDAFYTPERSEALPYVAQLLDDVLFYPDQAGELDPSGHFITLCVPDMFPCTSFDFFTDEGQQQFIRQNFHDIGSVYLVASRDGEFFPVGKVISDWQSSLEPIPISYPDLDFCLHRLLYLNMDEFELNQSGTSDQLTPTKDLSRPYLKQLMNGTLTGIDAEEIPDCEYISLWLPDVGLRFDFFLDGNEHGTYVRRVQHGGFEDLFLLSYDDGALASQIVLDWYAAAKSAQ